MKALRPSLRRLHGTETSLRAEVGSLLVAARSLGSFRRKETSYGAAEIGKDILEWMNPSLLEGLAGTSRVGKASSELPDFVVGMNGYNSQLLRAVLTSKGHKIGIFGRGGSGRKVLISLLRREQRVLHNFRDGIFLVEAGSIENADGKNIQELQGELHKQVTGIDKQFDTKDSGKRELCTLLKDRKCLVVIHDVRDFEVLQWLDVVRPQNGSKIIVTTQDSQLLDKFGATEALSINSLSDEDSRKLFFKHACGDKLLSERLVEIANQLVKCLDGLPLLLKIVAISMSQKYDVEQWVRALKEVEEARKHERKVYKFLKLSYDELKHEGPNIQECFLDLGQLSPNYWLCEIIIRWKALKLVTSKSEAIEVLDILDSYGLFSKYDPEDEFSKVGVHQDVRGLAAYIMCTEKPGERISKLNQKLNQFPAFSQGIRKIELAGNQLEHLPVQTIPTPALEVLDLQDNPLSFGIPSGFFKAFQNLKYLDLDRIKPEVRPEELAGLEKLEVLYLSRDTNDLRQRGHFTCENDHNQAVDLRLKNLTFVCIRGYCTSFLASSSSVQELHAVLSYECLLHLPESLCKSSNLKILSISVQDFSSNAEQQQQPKRDPKMCLFAGITFKHLHHFGLHLGAIHSTHVKYISKLNWQAFPNVRSLSLSNLDWSQVSLKSLVEIRQLHMCDYQLVTTQHPSFIRPFNPGDRPRRIRTLKNLPIGTENLPHLKVLDVGLCREFELKCYGHNFPSLEKLIIHSKDSITHIPPKLRVSIAIYKSMRDPL